MGSVLETVTYGFLVLTGKMQQGWPELACQLAALIIDS
jgi:hypothetical protein